MASINIPTHSEVLKQVNKYDRIRVLIENDEGKYDNDTFCPSLPNETGNARAVRKKLYKLHFNNIANELLSAPRDSIFKEAIRLEFKGGENNPLYGWSRDVVRGSDDVPLLQYVKDVVAIALRAYGMVWTVIDKPDRIANNFEEELREGRPYLNNIFPGNVVNWQMDNGYLAWFAYKCKHTDPWLDPTQPPPQTRDQVRVWTRSQYVELEGGQVTNVMDHNFGFVPVVYQAFFLPPDEKSIVGITPFFTSSNLIIAANTMASISYMELAKHGNSVLLVNENSLSATNMETDEDGVPRAKMQDPAAYNMFTYAGERPPEYLVKNLESVDKADNKAQRLFHDAIENERTMRSIIRKRETVRETALGKMIDAIPVAEGLRATAEDLQAWTIKVMNMVARMYGREQLRNSFTCEFPKTFDIGKKTFEQKLEELNKMVVAKYPSETGMKEAYKGLTPEITHNTEKQNAINAEIDNAALAMDNEAELQRQIDSEMEADRAFEESIANLSQDQQKAARSKRKLESE